MIDSRSIDYLLIDIDSIYILLEQINSNFYSKRKVLYYCKLTMNDFSPFSSKEGTTSVSRIRKLDETVVNRYFFKHFILTSYCDGHVIAII